MRLFLHIFSDFRAYSEYNRIDPSSLYCSVSRMLAASDSAPNIHTQRPVIPAPMPGNWRGVADGMASARKSVQQGCYEEAEAILIELLEFAPVEISAWKLLARVQRHLGHIEAGIESATRALRLQNNPLSNEPPASVTLVRLLWEQKEYHEARAMLVRLIEEQPENSELNELQRRWSMEKIV